MHIRALLKTIAEHEASDLHLCVGMPAMLRLCGRLEPLEERRLTNDDIAQMLYGILPKEKHTLSPGKEMDLAIELEGIGRFRTNIYYDNNGLCVAFRLIPIKIKQIHELGLPEVVNQCIYMQRGLVLVTGVTGSGKSTTLASLIDKINNERQAHIITIEDPIEFIHHPKKCIINQREIGVHTAGFPQALRAALREDPDVILLGEMRDLETISMAMTAAETGHLVFATLHTRGAAQSVDRIIDVFPPHQQEQIRVQLADVLEMVISQVLIPSKDKQTRCLACEVMVATSAIKHHIRDKKTFQIPTVIETGMNLGMQTLDKSLKELVKSDKIHKRDALPWISDRKSFEAFF